MQNNNTMQNNNANATPITITKKINNTNLTFELNEDDIANVVNEWFKNYTDNKQVSKNIVLSTIKNNLNKLGYWRRRRNKKVRVNLINLKNKYDRDTIIGLKREMVSESEEKQRAKESGETW